MTDLYFNCAQAFTNVCLYVDVYKLVISEIVRFKFGIVLFMFPDLVFYAQCNVFRVVKCAVHRWFLTIIITNVIDI
jgi:hypothetical protein